MMVSGAITKAEYWKLQFRQMSDRELRQEYECGMTDLDWHEKDAETNTSKSGALVQEMALRFFREEIVPNKED